MKKKMNENQVGSRKAPPQGRLLRQGSKAALITDSYQVFSGSTKSIRGEVPPVSPPDCIQLYGGGGGGGGHVESPPPHTPWHPPPPPPTPPPSPPPSPGDGGEQPSEVHIPGTPYSDAYPHVVWDEEPGKVRPEFGYRWVDRNNTQRGVVRIIPGTPYYEVAHVAWDEEELGKIRPEFGYQWIDPDDPMKGAKLRPELAALKEFLNLLGSDHDEKPMEMDEGQQETVLAALGAFNDTKLRAWVAVTVGFELRTKPGEQKQLGPWIGGPNNTNLVYTDYFFSHETYATKANTTAFEAGKVFWQIMKEKPVGGGKTLEEWFIHDFKAKYPYVISDLQEVDYQCGNQKVNLSKMGEGADYWTQFGIVFRAQALGLKLRPLQKG